MGRGDGRDAALNGALAATLARVSDVMAAARDPWWVIGSAAVALHGGATAVRDVDVLTSVRDAEAVAATLGIAAAPGSPHPLFRSTRFFAWPGPPLPVEFMAGFAVSTDGGWRPVTPTTRERKRTVFVPSRAELHAMLLRFGRAKDHERAAFLAD